MAKRARPSLTADVLRGLYKLTREPSLVAYMTRGSVYSGVPVPNDDDISDAEAAMRWLDKTQEWRKKKGFKE